MGHPTRWRNNRRKSASHTPQMEMQPVPTVESRSRGLKSGTSIEIHDTGQSTNSVQSKQVGGCFGTRSIVLRGVSMLVTRVYSVLSESRGFLIILLWVLILVLRYNFKQPSISRNHYNWPQRHTSYPYYSCKNMGRTIIELPMLCL